MIFNTLENFNEVSREEIVTSENKSDKLSFCHTYILFIYFLSFSVTQNMRNDKSQENF